ncbi:molybdenum cofactor guanylyltransferase [Corynebacterium comes]|uniref:Molybdopterin-guanine dinucleotide biosynthesis protein MobA n=1 Tax=Corynebacterium comes TaxID=2675218 RepID=A0A6B8W3G5_9CORY|nr:NTP transferase domain-containing protein [Corynebacterium comes]QGU04350.1 molybdopterin-guanine dinucleotide biosynthesis protein MobA [Corynebacterium comes]
MLQVIVLAGGRGARMGGVDKAQVTLDGVRLVDHLIGALAGLPVVVVSPHLSLDVPVVSEDPPFGGPVAGIAAGAAALESPEFVGVLSVDAPDSPALLPLLVHALRADPEADVAVVRSTDGQVQPLCAVWRVGGLRRSLARLDTVRDQAAKKLLRAADRVIEVPGDGAERDYDTLAELQRRGSAGLPRVSGR